MALQGNALKEYNAQFQRSMASPEALSDKKKPVVLDGAAVLDKYVGGESAAAMTGAEFYALVGHIKRQHGQRGEALEQELMKVTRQMDKKIRLLDWCTTNLGRKEQPIAQPTAALSMWRRPSSSALRNAVWFASTTLGALCSDQVSKHARSSSS